MNEYIEEEKKGGVYKYTPLVSVAA